MLTRMKEIDNPSLEQIRKFLSASEEMEFHAEDRGKCTHGWSAL